MRSLENSSSSGYHPSGKARAFLANHSASSSGVIADVNEMKIWRLELVLCVERGIGYTRVDVSSACQGSRGPDNLPTQDYRICRIAVLESVRCTVVASDGSGRQRRRCDTGSLRHHRRRFYGGATAVSRISKRLTNDMSFIFGLFRQHAVSNPLRSP
jgi:hypothetical protein